MKNFTPLEKQSKKLQRKHHLRKRKDWHGVNPATQKIESKKLYNRKRTRQGNDEHFNGGFCFYIFTFICFAVTSGMQGRHMPQHPVKVLLH